MTATNSDVLDIWALTETPALSPFPFSYLGLPLHVRPETLHCPREEKVKERRSSRPRPTTPL